MNADDTVYVHRCESDCAVMLHDPDTLKLIKVHRFPRRKGYMNPDEIDTVRNVNKRLAEMRREDEPRKGAQAIALIIVALCVLMAIALRAVI